MTVSTMLFMRVSLIVLFTLVTYLLLRRVVNSIEQRGYMSEQATVVLRGSVRWLSFIFAVLIVLHTLGVP